MKHFVALFFIFLNSCLFGATLKSIGKKQVEEAFINKTAVSIPTDNLNGKTIENTFSMFLDTQGQIFGTMSQKPENEPQTDQGVYRIANDGSMYITWNHWDGAKKICARFFETQNAIISIDCDNIFHTVFMKESIQSGNQLK